MLGLTRCDIADIKTICCLLYCVKQNALEITQTQQNLRTKKIAVNKREHIERNQSSVPCAPAAKDSSKSIHFQG